MVGHGNERRIGRGRRDARLGLAVVQVKMHARGVLEAAQTLRLVRNDALRLLLIVRLAGQVLDPAFDVPQHVDVRVKVHVFEVVADVARAFGVKRAVFGVDHDVGVVEDGNRPGRGGHQLVGIVVGVAQGVLGYGGKPQCSHRNFRARIIGHGEVAVIHFAILRAERLVQFAGRRRRQQVLALCYVQQFGITGCAGERR